MWADLLPRLVGKTGVYTDMTEQRATVRGAVVKTVTLTVETKPDEKGRVRFAADWKDKNGRPRGQYFFADVNVHAKMWRADGYRVRIKREVVG